MIIKLSLFILFTAIAIDFYKYSDQTKVIKEKRSIVATGSMTAFFGVYYLVINNQFWVISTSAKVSLVLAIAGTLMVFSGAVLNAYGRFSLSSNWANHIKIYEQHELVRTGLYRWVRHPLYATIMLMLFGGSLASRNVLSLLLVGAVFIPFMFYRARQEEVLLEAKFHTYSAYKTQTGMFFPKFLRRGSWS